MVGRVSWCLPVSPSYKWRGIFCRIFSLDSHKLPVKDGKFTVITSYYWGFGNSDNTRLPRQHDPRCPTLVSGPHSRPKGPSYLQGSNQWSLLVHNPSLFTSLRRTLREGERPRTHPTPTLRSVSSGLNSRERDTRQHDRVRCTVLSSGHPSVTSKQVVSHRFDTWVPDGNDPLSVRKKNCVSMVDDWLGNGLFLDGWFTLETEDYIDGRNVHPSPLCKKIKKVGPLRKRRVFL